MRTSYSFQEKGEKDSRWEMDATQVLNSTIFSKRVGYSLFLERKGIEESIEAVSAAIGGLSELLISKGLLSPQEFLKAIEGDDRFVVKDKKVTF